MALLITLDTNFGEERELYVRVNNLDQLTNHDEAGPDRIRFRGYVSEQAFRDRKGFVWEQVLDVPIDVAQPVWPQAYAALKAHDPTAAIEPLPPAPDEFAQPLPHNASDDDKARRSAAEALYHRTVADREARLGVATRLKSALAAAKDV